MFFVIIKRFAHNYALLIQIDGRYGMVSFYCCFVEMKMFIVYCLLRQDLVCRSYLPHHWINYSHSLGIFHPDNTAMFAHNIPLLLLLLLLSLVGVSRSQRRNPFLSPSALDSRQGLGGGEFLPENVVRARGLTEQLARRYHYLQYVKTVFRQLKEEYGRSAIY